MLTDDRLLALRAQPIRAQGDRGPKRRVTRAAKAKARTMNPIQQEARDMEMSAARAPESPGEEFGGLRYPPGRRPSTQRRRLPPRTCCLAVALTTLGTCLFVAGCVASFGANGGSAAVELFVLAALTLLPGVYAPPIIWWASSCGGRASTTWPCSTRTCGSSRAIHAPPVCVCPREAAAGTEYPTTEPRRRWRERTVSFDSLPALGVGLDVIATSTFFRALLPFRVRDFAAFFSTTHSDSSSAELRVRRGIRGDGVGPGDIIIERHFSHLR